MISKDTKYEFMKRLLLGKNHSVEERAIGMAYDDVKRTFRYHGGCAYPATGPSKEAIIKFLNDKGILKNQASYDKKFTSTCKAIIKAFTDNGYECYYGQAQKWINMTMKYLTILTDKYDKAVPFMHVPVDNVIYGVTDSLGIKHTDKAWSRMDETEYNEYQEAIKRHAESLNMAPIEWEYSVWMENNKNVTVG